MYYKRKSRLRKIPKSSHIAECCTLAESPHCKKRDQGHNKRRYHYVKNIMIFLVIYKIKMPQNYNNNNKIFKLYFVSFQVLNQFSQIPKLYHTPEFECFESAARENIEREICTLREHLLTGRKD